MYITKLVLNQFRNHLKCEICPDYGVNLFLGENGQGKTAVLEAAALALTGKSFRQGKNWIQQGKKESAVYLELEQKGVKHQIAVYLSENKTRPIFFFNGKKTSKHHVKDMCVFLTPENLSAVRGEASQRRKLVDELVWKLPDGKLACREFHHILAQKNKFLRLCKKGFYSEKDKTNCLESLNSAFLGKALRLIELRLKALKKLSPFWRERGQFFLQTSQFSVQYMQKNQVIRDLSTAQQLLEEDLQQKQQLELIQGVSLTGPQRHDLCFLHQGLMAKDSLSQGQQKALLISWKMAEWDQIFEQTQEKAPFFLDDIFSEIDQHFQKNLVRFLLDVQSQSFISTIENLEFLKDSKVFYLGSRIKEDHGTTIESI